MFQFVVDLWLGHNSGRAIPAGYYHLADEESHRVMRNLKFAQLVPPKVTE